MPAAPNVTFGWSLDNAREYLYPPGDSVKYQANLNKMIGNMIDAVSQEHVAKQVILQIVGTGRQLPPDSTMLSWSAAQASDYISVNPSPVQWPALGLQEQLDQSLVQVYESAALDPSQVKQLILEIRPS